MSSRLSIRAVLLALVWGCSRGPGREPAADTLSLAPLADSSAPVELRDDARTGIHSQPAQVAPRPQAPAPRKRRAAVPKESHSRPQATAQAYHSSGGSSDSNPSDTASTSRAADTIPAATKPDTALDARTAVGDSILPSATPVAPPTRTEPGSTSTTAPAASPVATASPETGAADSTSRSPEPASAPAATPSPANAPNANAAPNALPAGAQIRAALQDSINSLRNSVGQTVTATVSGDLRAPDGLAVLPSGSLVHLTIDRLSPARSRSAKDGELVLKADSVTTQGHTYRVDATVQPIPHELKGRGVTAGEVEKVGAGIAAGAVVGGVVSGKTKGAVVGGAVGAVGGAVVAAQTASRDVIVTPRTPITLILKSPLVRAP
jgi:hypothetical protein